MIQLETLRSGIIRVSDSQNNPWQLLFLLMGVIALAIGVCFLLAPSIERRLTCYPGLAGSCYSVDRTKSIYFKTADLHYAYLKVVKPVVGSAVRKRNLFADLVEYRINVRLRSAKQPQTILVLYSASHARQVVSQLNSLRYQKPNGKPEINYVDIDDSTGKLIGSWVTLFAVLALFVTSRHRESLIDRNQKTLKIITTFAWGLFKREKLINFEQIRSLDTIEGSLKQSKRSQYWYRVTYGNNWSTALHCFPTDLDTNITEQLKSILLTQSLPHISST